MSWSLCCALRVNGFHSWHSPMPQYHATVWWGLLVGRLHFGVSRKRSLARKLLKSKVCVCGGEELATPKSRRPDSQKERSTSAEKGALIFAWRFSCQGSKLQDGWGECGAPPTGQFTCRKSPQPRPSTLTTILEYGFLDLIIHQQTFIFFTFSENVLGSLLHCLLQLPWLLRVYSHVVILLRSPEGGVNHGHRCILFYFWL